MTPGRLVAVIIAGILSLLVALVLTVPAGLLWKVAGTQLQRQLGHPIQVKGVSGQLLNGEALIVAQGLPALMNWHLRPLAILNGQSPLTLATVLSDGRIDLVTLLTNPDQPTLQARGYLNLSMLNGWLARHRLQLAGRLDIRDLTLQIDRLSGRPVGAHGVMNWAGGPVRYPAGRQMKTAQMPPLRATIRNEGAEIRLDVTDEQGQPLMHIRLDQVGLAHIHVRKRLVDLAGAPWPGSEPPDTEIFNLRQRVL